MLASLLTLTALPLALVAAASGPVTGTGLISVLANPVGDINFISATPAQTIGCLNAAGKVVLDDCAEFTILYKAATNAYAAATDSGECSFYNEDAALHPNGDVFALNCSAAVTPRSVQFYTVVSTGWEWLRGRGDG